MPRVTILERKNITTSIAETTPVLDKLPFSYSIELEGDYVWFSIYGPKESVRRIVREGCYTNNFYPPSIQEDTDFSNQNSSQMKFEFRFHSATNFVTLTDIFWYLGKITSHFEDANELSILAIDTSVTSSAKIFSAINAAKKRSKEPIKYYTGKPWKQFKSLWTEAELKEELEKDRALTIEAKNNNKENTGYAKTLCKLGITATFAAIAVACVVEEIYHKDYKPSL